VFNGAAVPACTASDAELMAQGSAACPQESRVGRGFGSVVTTSGPATEHVALVTLFNYGKGVIELLEFLDGGVKTVDRAEFEGRSTMVLHPAVVPGFTEREFSFIYRGMPVGAAKPFITTPPECAPSGVWDSRLTYTVTTGASYSSQSTQRCRTPAIQASLKPKRVRAGRQTRFRVRLRSSDARCIAGATVRLAGRRLRTNNAGRATIAKTFRRPGRRILIASKRGCGRGRATLSVLPAR
jgi:hypothetical protein